MVSPGHRTRGESVWEAVPAVRQLACDERGRMAPSILSEEVMAWISIPLARVKSHLSAAQKWPEICESDKLTHFLVIKPRLVLKPIVLSRLLNLLDFVFLSPDFTS